MHYFSQNLLSFAQLNPQFERPLSSFAEPPPIPLKLSVVRLWKDAGPG